MITAEDTVTGRRSVTTYDARGRRVIREDLDGDTPVATTNYLYDGWNVVGEVITDAATGAEQTKSYTWGTDLSGTMQGAGGVGGLLAVADSAGGDHHYFYDGNGNVTTLIAAGGDVTATYRYDGFGNTIAASGSYASANTYRFSTKPQDDLVTGLYYYGFRYYQPTTGRWINKDPIEELGGVNLYGFSLNDVPNSFDYLGLDAETECSWRNVGEMRGSVGIMEFIADNIELVTDLSDIKDKPIDGFWDFVTTPIEEGKFVGIRVVNLEFRIDGFLDVTIICERCVCNDNDGINYEWWAMSPKTVSIPVPQFDFTVPIRISPGILGKLKKAQRIYQAGESAAENGGEIDWENVFDISEQIWDRFGENFKDAISKSADFSKESLKRLCEDHWDSTTETPPF